jgi:cell wall-associated NlpC family hydrolase
VLALALATGSAKAGHASTATGGVPGVGTAQLDPAWWIARLPAPDRPLLDAAGIARHNAALLVQDPSMHDLSRLPDAVPRAQVERWLGSRSTRPTAPLYRADGRRVDEAALDALERALARDAMPAQVRPRYGLVVSRANLRTFPTSERVFRSVGDTDIDRWQESALFPGDPVAVIHASADGQWSFVLSPRYAAWVESRHVALGDRQEVLGYARRTPARVVTGSHARTAYTPERPAVSRVLFDMGVRLPLAAATNRPVHGQHPLGAHVIDLPTRDERGALAFAPALLPRSEDSHEGPLPATLRHLVSQSFKFLGERYGWGHDYGARDCSGFVSEVYRSLGIELPRNTGDQALSPVLGGRTFAAADVDARAAAIAALQVGDLVYIPGHVMLVIGHVDGAPYVIHDTAAIQLGQGDRHVRVPINGVAVTPLLPLMFDRSSRVVDRITAIRHVRPAP